MFNNSQISIEFFPLNVKGFVVSDYNILSSFKGKGKAVVYIFQLVSDESIYYIGSSCDFLARFAQHRHCVKNSIRKGCPKFYYFVN